jgi:23S rRNA pseudouridine2605 synthase
MAKRKLSRTDPRSAGRSSSRGNAKPGSKKRTTDSSREERSERPTRKFSDKPFDKRKPSSRFDKEGGSERPKRNYTRGDGDKRNDSFERKRPFNREGGDRKFSSGFSSDSKPRRGFPEGFKREDDERPKRPFGGAERGFKKENNRTEKKRPFEKQEGTKRPFEKRQGSERPFNKRPFDRDERPKRPFNRDERSDNEREERPRRPFNSFDRGEEFHRPARYDRGDENEQRQDADAREKRPRKSFTESRTISSKGYKDRKGDVEETPRQIRLNRYLANSGVSSRREADEIIKMGLVTVNGKTITEMGFQVQPGDVVKHEGKMLRAEKPVYVLMNKPKGFLTTTNDPEERRTVMEMVAGHIKERIYPVGRLDRNTTGLLLLTNDGALAEQLSHPSYNVKKIYKAELDRPLAKTDFEKIAQGVQLEEGRAMVDDIAIVSEDGKTVGLEIHIGWNRVVRRIFESLEYQVVKLDRTIYAGLDKKDLPRGNWRHLKEEEIIRLKHLKKGTK